MTTKGGWVAFLTVKTRNAAVALDIAQRATVAKGFSPVVRVKPVGFATVGDRKVWQYAV